MDYWEVRKRASKIIPRLTLLVRGEKSEDYVKEKGRKANYSQFDLIQGKWESKKRLLNPKEINSFLEISVRAAACPLPFNMDIWDGLVCPFNCIYCYANYFRASLYTSFFDNSKAIGLRHCNPDFYRREMDKMLYLRELPKEKKESLSGIRKAFSLEIPVRMGIRFEDFLHVERSKKVSLAMIKYLSEINYPLMINTKSDVAGEEEYVEALSSISSGAAVHVTALTSDEGLVRKIEPGAPSYKKRLTAIRNLTQAGVRVVARIEPYLIFLVDDPGKVEEYIETMWEAGVRNITFDTYSYTAMSSGIRTSFLNRDIDYDRLCLLGCDSQLLGSLLLGRFMELFRNRGFSCSTFDMGNVPNNDQSVCCEVGDWFSGGFNYGCSVMAARFVKERKGPVSWKDFFDYVKDRGGFLSPSLEVEVHRQWNLGGNSAYSHGWASGMVPCGWDEFGLIWRWEDTLDSRKDLLEDLV
ncbi:MAG: radical SAM protein [Deltaproteobacteria bacterium]|nr:radical SAM protein [Deltaproteobacteria bacterium]